jgi:hypothetical protein
MKSRRISAMQNQLKYQVSIFIILTDVLSHSLLIKDNDARSALT